jgi:arginase
VTVVVVPFHQDKKLADDHVPLPPGSERLVLDPELPDGEIWRRLTALYDAAATQIAAVIARSGLTAVPPSRQAAAADSAEAAVLPSAGVVSPSGKVDLPGGGVVSPNGEVVLPGGGVVSPSGEVVLPGGGVVAASGEVVLPGGGVVPSSGGGATVSAAGAPTARGGEIADSRRAAAGSAGWDAGVGSEQIGASDPSGPTDPAGQAGASPQDVALPHTTTVISGDCLVALATLAGVQRAGLDPALIWFDAHGDVHTLETTTSGYLGGLSLRLALGAHADRLAPLGLRAIPEDRTVLVDARDLDPPESDYLAGSAVRRSSVADLSTTQLPDGPLVLHIDVDVIDPADLPGLLFPAPGGPPASAVLAAVRHVLATGRVVALDIACPWHPTLDARTQQIRADLITALLSAT